MIRYTCRQCGARMESPDSMAGRLETCPKCGAERKTPHPVRRAYRAGAGILCVLVLGIGWVLYRSEKLHDADIAQSAAATNRFEEAFKPLMFFGDNYKRSVELRKKVFDYSIRYGIDACEVAGTWYEIYRTTPYLNGDPRADAKREEMLESCLMLSKSFEATEYERGKR